MTKKSLTKDKKMDIIVGDNRNTQVSPSGMATASQAVPGEFDSRHPLQIKIGRLVRPIFFALITRESRTPRGNFALKNG